MTQAMPEMFNDIMKYDSVMSQIKVLSEILNR